MPLLSKEEFTLYENIINLSQNEMRLVMANYLGNKYKDNCIVTKDYIYAIGDIPIALVAHMDTVFEDSYNSYIKNGQLVKPTRVHQDLYYDQWKETIACPMGAGFDDRAGIYAIYKIIEAGFKPTIILTTDEEIGGVGARKFVNDYSLPAPNNDLRYIIQLDRRGENDCVFYSLQYPEFEKYIESFGFKTNFGSFSDISTLCPAWGIAGVNLSIGYENEHSVEEILNVKNWLATIEKVKTMLQETDIPFWEYKKSEVSNYNYPYSYGYNYGYSYDDIFDSDYLIECANCHQQVDVFDTTPVVGEDGKARHYCTSCIEKVEECAKCGEIFFKENKKHKYCKNCSKEMRKTWRLKKKN